MTVTSGFFNSINGDRKYDTLQMAELFDGLINDGVYETIYKQFRVSSNEGLTIKVDTGRGWFKHTWIKNDNLKLITLDPSEPVYQRIDAIVIQVDHRDEGRRDDIIAVKGIPAAIPDRPELSQTDDLYQVPLAYITVNSGVDAITDANITNMVGTSSCPFVTGVVEVMDIDWLMEQWQKQWDEKIYNHEKDWYNWYETHTSQYNHDFLEWFENLKLILDGDVVTGLVRRIMDLEYQIDLILNKRLVHGTIDDNLGEPILDNEGRDIISLIKLSIDGNCKCE